jgi:hypothetical protein
MAAIFTAEFQSDCVHCDEPIQPGHVALHDEGEVSHVRCPLLYVYVPARDTCKVCNFLHGSAQKECDDY